jgi:hypothetical protein
MLNDVHVSVLVSLCGIEWEWFHLHDLEFTYADNVHISVLVSLCGIEWE